MEWLWQAVRSVYLKTRHCRGTVSCRGPQPATPHSSAEPWGTDPQLEWTASLQGLVKTTCCICKAVLQHSGFRTWSPTVWSKPIKSNFDAVLMPGAIISQSLTTMSVFDLSCCEWFGEDFNQWPPGKRCCSRVFFFPLSLINLPLTDTI